MAVNMSGGLIFPDTFENVNILNIGMPLCHPISHIFWVYRSPFFRCCEVETYSRPHFLYVLNLHSCVNPDKNILWGWLFHRLTLLCLCKRIEVAVFTYYYYIIIISYIWTIILNSSIPPPKQRQKPGRHSRLAKKQTFSNDKACSVQFCNDVYVLYLLSNWISLESLNKISSYSQLLEYLFRWQ